MAPQHVSRVQASQAIRRDAGKIGLLLLIMLLAGYGLMIFLGLAWGWIQQVQWLLTGKPPSSLPVDPSSPTVQALFSILPVIFSEVLVLSLARPLLGTRLSGLFRKQQTTAELTLLGAGACLGAGLIALLFSSLYFNIIYFFQSQLPVLPSTETEVTAQPLAMILTMGYTCLVAPVLEEIIFRGYVLQTLRKYGAPFAVLMTSLCFSLVHMNWVQMAPPFFIGLILCFVALRAHSLWPCILCHMANNIVAVLLDYLPSGFSPFQFLPLLYTLGGLLLLGFFIRRQLPPMAAQFRPAGAYESTTLECLGVALSAPSIVVALVLYGISLLLPLVMQLT